MKKIICLFLALAMLISLTACFESEEEKEKAAFDAAVKEADEIFDEASDKKVEYKTDLDENDDDEQYYRVEATFNSDKFENVDEMKEYAEEIIDGPYKDAKKVLKGTDLEIHIFCLNEDGDECFYIIDGDIEDSYGEEDDETEHEHGEVVVDPDAGRFPVANYNGEDFTFLYIKQSDSMRDYYGGEYIDSESLTGNKISDAVFNRNLAVEQKYNVDINERVVVNSAPAVLLQQYIMSGDFTFDVVYGWGYKLGSCVTENYFADFNNLETADFTQEYWCPGLAEDLSVAGKQYLSQNEISMNVVTCSSFLFYNKSVAERLNIDATYGSLYAMVDNGTWTYDKFLEMVKGACVDTDGDSKITRNDIFGLLDGNGLGTEALQNCGIYYTKETETGYELTLMSEKTFDVITMVEEIYSNDKYVKDFEDIWNEEGSDMSGFDDQWQYARSFFTTDNALFLHGSGDTVNETAFRNMESDYGILPFPKYDQAQENYNSTMNSQAFLFALPSTVRTDISTASIERTSHILDYMAFKSHEILLPATYENILAGVGMDKTDNTRMLDIIRKNVHYEI
ncbi:MAG: extracellular solute-binding protein, partial [Clostridia bacterium]|nr:extracellular solute-binding protein [Clostridia bacterium]